MPTVLRTGGAEFRIYIGDHEPPHDHVFVSGDEVVILLGSQDEAPQLRETYASRGRTRRALDLTCENQLYLLNRWEGIHG